MWKQDMKPSRYGVGFGALLMVAGCAGVGLEEHAESPPALEAFADAIHHRQMKEGDGYLRHDASDVRAIADNMLLMQRNNGGWEKNLDPLEVLDAQAVARFEAEKSIGSATFDNRNIYTQIAYLMEAHELSGDERYRSGALRALDYLLDQQIASCGGWPHTVPASTSYQDAITFNDDVMTGILNLLRDIHESFPAYASLGPEIRAEVDTSLAAGEDCLLRLQVRQNGRLTAWAGQYDRETLMPVKARSYELASLASAESVGVLSYLMRIEAPTPQQVAAVDAGVAWLREVALSGLRIETFELEEEVAYEFHRTKRDRRLVADPEAPPLWARYYDLEDNSVMLANRDGVRVTGFEEVHPERRSGYSWFGNWGADILEKEYPAWTCRIRGEGC